MESKLTPGVGRRTLIKSGVALGAMSLAGPAIIKARGETPVKIGMVDPLTGILSALAQSEVEGAKYAVADDQQEGRHPRPARSNCWSKTPPTTSAPVCRRRAS